MITRDALKSGQIADMVRAHDPSLELLSDIDRAATLDRTLHSWNGDDVWIFGYGSLIWNPAFHYAERRLGRIYGYHRQFCLQVYAGRGSRACPGLLLALENGGSCQGVAFRIAADQVREELDIVWRREMIAGSYRPVWTTFHNSGDPVQAIAFVMDRSHERYAGRLPENDIVNAIALAEGPIGRCADYLFNTVDHLGELGISDHRLIRLASLVRGRMNGTP